jgi:hypothetical protein
MRSGTGLVSSFKSHADELANLVNIVGYYGIIIVKQIIIIFVILIVVGILPTGPLLCQFKPWPRLTFDILGIGR